TKAELETLVLSERQLTLGVGLERKLTVMAFYTNGYLRRVTDKVAWSSSADDVADVNGEGNVYARAPGVTTLTATLDGITATAAVQVIPPGDVVTWGEPDSGGNCDSNSACERPKEVRAIVSARYAFAAINQDYKVTAWGDTQLGGNTRDVIGADLENVKEVVGGDGAFAALRRDGKVATWG
ncbi:Ig-like domain-containing protein, partial [Aeromonas hydrophila]|uniref:Ig-like domain-containing protein n=1 Tax=Aeromonas hydrophila TaxID=644 RepID=UPI0038D0164F